MAGSAEVVWEVVEEELLAEEQRLQAELQEKEAAMHQAIAASQEQQAANQENRSSIGKPREQSAVCLLIVSHCACRADCESAVKIPTSNVDMRYLFFLSRFGLPPAPIMPAASTGQ